MFTSETPYWLNIFTVLIAIFSSLGFSRFWVTHRLKQQEASFALDLEDFKLRLKKSEFLFQKEYNAFVALVAMNRDLLPEHGIPYLDEDSAADLVSGRFSTIEEELADLLRIKGAALPKPVWELLARARDVAGDGKLGTPENEGCERELGISILKDLSSAEETMHEYIRSQSASTLQSREENQNNTSCHSNSGYVRIVSWMRERAIFQWIGLVGIGIAVWQFSAALQGQAINKQLGAWQVISTSEGRGGNGGRVQALQILHSTGESLDRVNLDSAYLRGISLPHASLSAASFEKADLSDAVLDAADLSGARFISAIMVGASFRRAQLTESNLCGANAGRGDLSNANLRRAKLDHCRLSNAVLDSASFELAVIRTADFEQAEMQRADFTLADLRSSNMAGIKNWKEIRSLKDANIWDVRNAPEGFVKWATETKGAVVIRNNPIWGAYRDSVVATVALPR